LRSRHSYSTFDSSNENDMKNYTIFAQHKINGTWKTVSYNNGQADSLDDAMALRNGMASNGMNRYVVYSHSAKIVVS
jgi:hypothetical protein